MYSTYSQYVKYILYMQYIYSRYSRYNRKLWQQLFLARNRFWILLFKLIGTVLRKDGLKNKEQKFRRHLFSFYLLFLLYLFKYLIYLCLKYSLSVNIDVDVVKVSPCVMAKVSSCTETALRCGRGFNSWCVLGKLSENTHTHDENTHCYNMSQQHSFCPRSSFKVRWVKPSVADCVFLLWFCALTSLHGAGAEDKRSFLGDSGRTEACTPSWLPFWRWTYVFNINNSKFKSETNKKGLIVTVTYNSLFYVTLIWAF